MRKLRLRARARIKGIDLPFSQGTHLLARLVRCASHLSWSTSSKHPCSFSTVRCVEVTSDAPSLLSFHDLSCSTRLRRPCKEGAGCRRPREYSFASELFRRVFVFRARIEPQGVEDVERFAVPIRETDKPTQPSPYVLQHAPKSPLFLFFSTNRVCAAIASRSYLPAPERDRCRPSANTRRIWTTGGTYQSRRMVPRRKRGSAKRSAVAVLRTPPGRWPCTAGLHHSSDAAKRCPLPVGRGQMRRRRQ